MMKTTFLHHSGFMVNLPSVTLLFDWCQGELPPIRPGIPLLVFVSHSHNDHFQPRIFDLDASAFLLGRDLKPGRLKRKGVAPEILEKCIVLYENQTAEPLPGVTVETLRSTDMGVAFLVTADGKTVFHAGDLNWWHWTGESAAWNETMARNFLAYTEPLRDRTIDLAMLPLDPRMEQDGFRGPKHFLETADIRCFIPMHQWDDFAFTGRFLAQYPDFSPKTLPVLYKGQVFDL